MDAIETLLLRRNHQVVLVAATRPDPAPASEVDALEARLAELGFLLAHDLGRQLRALPSDELTTVGRAIEATLAAQLGADRPHVPLFRGFPRGIPRDTWSLYVRRIVTWWLQNPEQPCLWCGEVGTVRALRPCGHLVCERCWDGADYSACPICYRRLVPDEPFLRPSPPPDVEPGARTRDPALTFKLLHLCRDRELAVRELLQGLLGRATPLSPQDRQDLELLIAALGPALLSELPAEIPVKETAALVFGTLLRNPGAVSETLAAAAAHLRNATDVLRTLSVWMGGDSGLLKPPDRMRSPPRALRRGLLAALERLPPHLLAEDLLRHAGLWKRLGVGLHPFEHADRHPNTALAFAALRRSKPVPGDRLHATVATAAARHPESFQRVGATVRVRGWAGHLEGALRSGDLELALRLLGQRPGELLRRLDHLLRRLGEPTPPSPTSPDLPTTPPLPTTSAATSTPTDATDATPLLPRLRTALDSATGRASPALLMTALAQLRARTAPLPRRVFFPRGNVLKAFATVDRRPPLAEALVQAVTDPLERELLTRAGRLPPFEAAILDAGLADLMVPFNERTASRSLIAVPRGSSLPIATDQRMRLFVHWTEPPDERVDLDLSVAFFDAAWQFKGLCDFTELVFSEEAAVHSGDLTSAPAPLGAAEFVDLDTERLALAGVRHLVVIVFSYNDVSFDRLPDAFAGFMLRPTDRPADDGAPFDPRTVAQRFDLQGEARAAVPLTFDLATRRMRWLDARLPTAGGYHQVERYRGALARLGLDFTAYFGAGARMTLWELACLHAAARAPLVHVRRRDGGVDTYRRRDDEAPHGFHRRLVDQDAPDETHTSLPATGPALLALLRDDLPAAPGSEGYALRWAELSPTRVRRLSAADLVAALARE